MPNLTPLTPADADRITKDVWQADYDALLQPDAYEDRIFEFAKQARLDLPRALAALEAAWTERDNWIETAAQNQRNTDYYCGLLDQIAAYFREEAFTADDGTHMDTPLRAKMPELVARLTAQVQALEVERDKLDAALQNLGY